MNVRAIIENAGLPRRGFTVKKVERMSEIGPPTARSASISAPRRSSTRISAFGNSG